MAQFKAFNPAVEVKGAAVLAIVEGMGAFRATALRMLAKYGITDLKSNEWYSQQAWLDTFRDIAGVMGAPVLQVIGNKIPLTATWPDDIQTIEEALTSIDAAYHLNHRGGEIGHYRLTVTGPRSGQFYCDNPYPCDFDRGIIEGTGRRFAPKEIFFLVKHDETQPCRKRGDDACLYQVTW